MTYSGFGKKLNKVIYNTLNGHRHFNMDKIITIRQICIIGRLPWSNIMKIYLFVLWLLTLWSAMSVLP